MGIGNHPFGHLAKDAEDCIKELQAKLDVYESVTDTECHDLLVKQREKIHEIQVAATVIDRKKLKRIAQLKAENQEAWNTCDEAETKCRKLEALIEAVQCLPKQWRDKVSPDHHDDAYSVPAAWVIECADELEKVLNKEQG
jgi:DNA repair exonuclease SbcCD ATPase subunit